MQYPSFQHQQLRPRVDDLPGKETQPALQIRPAFLVHGAWRCVSTSRTASVTSPTARECSIASSTKFIDEAMEHSLAAGDVAEAVRLVETHRQAAMNQERWLDLQRWLSLFSREVIDSPPSCSCEAGSCIRDSPSRLLWLLRGLMEHIPRRRLGTACGVRSTPSPASWSTGRRIQMHSGAAAKGGHLPENSYAAGSQQDVLGALRSRATWRRSWMPRSALEGVNDAMSPRDT